MLQSRCYFGVVATEICQLQWLWLVKLTHFHKMAFDQNLPGNRQLVLFGAGKHAIILQRIRDPTHFQNCILSKQPAWHHTAGPWETCNQWQWWRNCMLSPRKRPQPCVLSGEQSASCTIFKQMVSLSSCICSMTMINHLLAMSGQQIGVAWASRKKARSNTTSWF